MAARFKSLQFSNFIHESRNKKLCLKNNHLNNNWIAKFLVAKYFKWIVLNENCSKKYTKKNLQKYLSYYPFIEISAKNIFNMFQLQKTLQINLKIMVKLTSGLLTFIFAADNWKLQIHFEKGAETACKTINDCKSSSKLNAIVFFSWMKGAN